MRLRFLPVAILVTVLMLGVKVGNLLFGLEAQAIAPSHAQEVAPAKAGPVKAPGGQGAAATTEPRAGGAAAAADAAKANGKSAPARDAAKGDPGGLPSDPTLFSQAEIDLLQKLASRRSELERWSKDLTMREQLLKATEKRIDNKLVELRDIQGKVKAMLKQYDKDQEGRLKSLVKIYENMKPKDAAQIFEELEMDVLLDVVERMKERKVAPVLALMNPEKAREVTLELAQRRELPLPK
jgi:flagellar motility protein MotE (MotC chaperone)